MADDLSRIAPSLGGSFPGSTGSGSSTDPVIQVALPTRSPDLTTIVAMAASVILICTAILIGNSNASFFDLPSVLLVIFGTITVTCVSYTGRELRLALPVIAGSWVRESYDASKTARELLDLSVIARKRGILSLNSYSNQLSNHPFMNTTMQMVSDGLPGPDIDRLVNHNIDIMVDSYKKAAGMLRRASEIAPAMGLIGTLVGLVQMLVNLDDPSRIGPSMALALLTTFYGAIMGSVVLAPLAAKIERNANDDVIIKTLIQTAARAMIQQSNPRKLELELNSLLPPDQRVEYFEYGR